MPTTRARELACGLLGADGLLLDGTLDGAGDPIAILRDAAGSLAPGGTLVVAARAARNLHTLSAAVDGEAHEAARGAAGFTRRSLLDVLDGAGLDVAALEVVRDGEISWIPLPVHGGLGVRHGRLALENMTADDVEELTAEALVAVARPAPATVPDCSIVIPVCGERELVERCLHGVLPEAAAHGHEVVIADDASADGTEAYLDGLADVTLVRHAERRGFAAAANAGARAATGDIVIFLHSDAVPRPGALSELVRILRTRPAAGAAGPLLLNRWGTVDAAGLAHGPDRLAYPLHRGADADIPPVRRLREVPSLSSACLAVRRRWLVEIGGFDEALHSFEDDDLCLRLRARGRTLVFCPSAVVDHREGGTPGPRTLVDDVAYFFAKWHGRIETDDEIVSRADGLHPVQLRQRAWHMARRGRRRPQAGEPPAVLLSGNIFGHSGYDNEARSFVWSFVDAGVPVYLNPFRWPTPEERAALGESRPDELWRMATNELPREFVHVCNLVAVQYQGHSWAQANVGRTMWETDHLPEDRVERCLLMDEIWVPCAWNVDTFAAAGIPRERLHVVPSPLEAGLYDELPARGRLESTSGFTFLSVFVWSRRKGWDALVSAYVEEFSGGEDVTLVLASRPRSGTTMQDSRRELEDHVRLKLGRSLTSCPPIVLQPMDLPQPAMPALFRAADAFVLPSRGEGWGRPLMEAMACSLPTIGTRWSGNLEFMDEDNSYLVDYEMGEVPSEGWLEFAPFKGHLWAEPSVESLRRAMRHVFEERAEAAARGERARAHVLEHCGPRATGAIMAERLAALAGGSVQYDEAERDRARSPTG